MPPDALQQLLSKDYAAGAPQGRSIRSSAAQRLQAADARRILADAGRDRPQARGDTIYLTAADSQGNVVSLIQSLFDNFGAGIVAGDTGIVLHNRGSLFSLRAAIRTVLAPGKRPFHTLVPAMVMKDGRPWLSFGVMGGDMQPQGHVQVLLNLVDFGMNVQEAGEAPRFRHSAAGLALESAISPEARFGLNQRGHRSSRRSAIVRRLPGHPVRPEDRRDDGRIGSAEGRPGDRILKSLIPNPDPESHDPESIFGDQRRNIQNAT